MSGCWPAASGSLAVDEEAKRLCYLVNFRSKEVSECPNASQQAQSVAKRQKIASDVQGSDCVMNAPSRHTNQALSSSQQVRANQIFVHQEEQVNRMRERLFRLLSKVPIQVEPIKPARREAALEESSSRKAIAADHLKDPLIVKYYQERSLNSIIELHFSCSLIKQSAKCMSINGAEETRRTGRSGAACSTISNSHAGGWQQTARREKYQTARQARLAEFIGQPEASSQRLACPAPGGRPQQRPKRAPVRQQQQQQQQQPHQSQQQPLEHAQQQQSFSISSASEMRVAPSAGMAPHSAAAHYSHASGPFFSSAPTSEQQNNAPGDAMLPACAPFDQQPAYAPNNSAAHYSAAQAAPTNPYYQITHDEPALVGAQHGTLYTQANQTGYNNEFQAACVANYTTAAISVADVSGSYGEPAAAYELEAGSLVDTNCKVARLEQPIDYHQNGPQLACIVWPQIDYSSQNTGAPTSQRAASSARSVLEVSSQSHHYNSQQLGQPTEPNLVPYLNPPSFLASQSNEANQMIDLQETQSQQQQQQQQYGNYFTGRHTQADSHSARSSRAVICATRPTLAPLNSESCSSSSVSSNGSNTSLSLSSGSPAPAGHGYAAHEARLLGSCRPHELQDEQIYRVQPICMATNCSINLRPITDGQATIHTR